MVLTSFIGFRSYSANNLFQRSLTWSVFVWSFLEQGTAATGEWHVPLTKKSYFLSATIKVNKFIIIIPADQWKTVLPSTGSHWFFFLLYSPTLFKTFPNVRILSHPLCNNRISPCVNSSMKYNTGPKWNWCRTFTNWVKPKFWLHMTHEQWLSGTRSPKSKLFPHAETSVYKSHESFANIGSPHRHDLGGERL